MLKKSAIGAAAALVVAGGGWVGTAVAQQNQRIEITGSAIRQIGADSALPITVITREDIAKSGATTAAELLDRISANNGGGYNQVLAIGDAARPGFAGASLRGLGSNTTLVLLNGRRLAVFAFDGGGVDLNSIALGAIERVEVLRDGASALYGTDAIAGVINFITRRDFTGIELNAGIRVPEKSGGKDQHATATFGFGDLAKNGFNVFGNLSYDKYDALKASSRDFAKTAFLPNAQGGRFDRTSGNTIPASIFVAGVGTVNPGVPNCLAPASFQRNPTDACRFDYASVIDILPPQDKIGGLLRGTLLLGKDHEAYLEYNKTTTTTTFNISPSPVSSATTFNGDDVLYPAGGKWYPRAVNPATGQMQNGLLWYQNGALTRFVPLSGDLPIFWRSLDAGPRGNEAKATQDRIVVGARGTLFGNWDYDTAYMRSTSDVTESYVSGLLSETRLRRATCAAGSGACGPLNATFTPRPIDPDINPFGRNDAAGLAAIAAATIMEPVRISKAERSSVDARISGEIMKLAGGAAAMAVGLESRREKLTDTPLAILSTGDVLGGGGDQQAVIGSRRVQAVFGELQLPFTKSLQGLAQVRYDKYSDFGNTTNPKVGLKWAPMREFSIRGSYGTGFRAPTLPELFSPVTQTNTGGSYNDPYYESRVGNCYDAAGNPTANFNPTFCSAQLTVKQGGNVNVKPEESKQFTLGFVFQPTRDISVEIDAWNIKMKGQIGIPDADARLAGFLEQFLADPTASYDASTSKLSAAGKAALNAGATGNGVARKANGNFDFVSVQYDNVSDTDVKGVDISIDALLAKTSLGDFRGSLDATYIGSWKQNGTEFVGQYASFGPVVRWKNRMAIDWTRGAWNSELGYRWQSGYQDQGGTRMVGNYELFDLSVAYRGVKNLTLRAAILNLLDRDPPYSRQGDYFHVGYDPTIGDPRGRAISVGATYSFK